MVGAKHAFTSARVGAALALVLSTGSAHAGAFGLREQSAVGQGMSFAGAAAGGAGLGSMFWNPATMTQFPGYRVEAGMSLIIPESKLKVTNSDQPAWIGNRSGDIGQDAVLPASYASGQVLPDLWVGVGINTPYGLTTKPSASWGPRVAYGNTTEVFSVGVTPTVAYRISDTLSVGAGIQILYFKATYFTTGSSPAILAGKNIGIQGDSWGVGGTLGATWTPAPGTEIGLGYRSAVQQDLEGIFRTVGDTPIKMRVVLPEQVTLGIRQRVNAQWDVLAGFEWTNWSRLQVPAYRSEANGATLGRVPLAYKDGWYLPVGVEYRWNRDLTLRAGVAYEKSPIETSNRSTRLPDNDRIWTSLGASWKWSEQLAFDLAYTHIFAKNGKLALAPGNPVYDVGSAKPTLFGDTEAKVDIITAGLSYRFDAPAPAAALPQSAPAVRK